MRNITIQLHLSEEQAETFMRWLGARYDAIIDEICRDPRYHDERNGPHSPGVQAEHPYLVGLNSTIQALRSGLKASGQAL